MSECRGLQPHDWMGVAMERTKHCPGCSSSQGDRLSKEDREWFDGFASFSRAYAQGSDNIQPTREGMERIIRLVEKLAPRPGGSEG